MLHVIRRFMALPPLRVALLAGLLAIALAPLVQAEPAEADWLELMPPADRKALEAMPDIGHNSPEAPGRFDSKGGLKADLSLPPVMHSTNTVKALDGKRLRLGGYPVPLENDGKGRFTQFFLVPYPGACIHVPPPPPNQIVLVRYPRGIRIDDIYEPIWISGPLKVEHISNDMADAAYTMQAESVRPVTEDDL